MSLDDAEHLLTRKDDSIYVADVISAWVHRYLDAEAVGDPEESGEAGVVTVAENGIGKFGQDISVGPHLFHADEPTVGRGAEYRANAVSAALRRAWGLHDDDAPAVCGPQERSRSTAYRWMSVTTRSHAEDCEACETREGKVDTFEREITLEGDLDAETRQRLLEIADKCPVHRTLHSEVQVVTTLKGA